MSATQTRPVDPAEGSEGRRNPGEAGRHRRERADGAPRGGRSAMRARARSRARRLNAAGLAIGLAGGLAAAVVFLPGHGGSGQPDRPAAPKPPVTIGSQAASGSGGMPDPAALDAEWIAYSDQSSCADWAGGDGVSAISLSSSQIAWFFSDTYLGPAGPATGFSHISGFLHNSVVIQTMTGRGSKFVTMTGGDACSAPGHQVAPATSVVSPPRAPGAPSDRYWDEDGIRVGDTVVKFYNRYLPGNIPFVPTGTVIAAYPVSQLSSAGHGPAFGAVARPQLFPLPLYTPAAGGTPIMWGAAVLRAGDTVYVYGTQSPGTSAPGRQLYLARVPAARLTQFAAWQFYAGPGGWAASQAEALPVQPAGSGLGVSSGFSVVRAGGRYWLIQADPVVGSNDIDAYPAAAPWGPFDPGAGIVLYRDPGIGLDAAHDYRIMYEARAEPALSTSHALVISYNVNSTGVTTGCVPMSGFTNTVTQPRFIVVPLTDFGAGGGQAAVRVGPSDYPKIVSRDPSQWFDGWHYPGGCPPVPGVGYVRAAPKPGGVRLSWPDAGLGVRYDVYVQAPGAAGYLRQATVHADSVTLSGLPAGTYVARVVPANLRDTTGPAAQVPFTVPGT